MPHSSELNPEHRVTASLRGHWHKILALHMQKLGLESLTLTPADFATPPQGLNVVAVENAEGLTIRLVDNVTAHRMASGG